MDKKNCWEYKGCGREPGGAKVADLGVCIAATETTVDGLHDGKNAGRVCWAVAGTLCGGKLQGSHAEKLHNCLACEFYMVVSSEEGEKFLTLEEILVKLYE